MIRTLHLSKSYDSQPTTHTAKQPRMDYLSRRLVTLFNNNISCDSRYASKCSCVHFNITPTREVCSTRLSVGETLPIVAWYTFSATDAVSFRQCSREMVPFVPWYLVFRCFQRAPLHRARVAPQSAETSCSYNVDQWTRLLIVGHYAKAR
jgi:hypothetical protein